MGLLARDIVVFAKGDSFVLGSGAETTDPAKVRFLDDFKANLARPSSFEGPFPLVVLPEFGREVPGATGEIRYQGSYSGGFVVHVNLGGLLPDHKYILTLNGNPERQGNDMLVDSVPNNAMEKYYDFLTVTTGANGQYDATFDIRLPAGPYDVRFYVKDSADFKIVLYRNFFKFKVD
jgi:hypothetical protein